MLPPDYKSWSPARISQEIRNREDYIRTLNESIAYHQQEYDRFPEGGYGASDLETTRIEAREEIGILTRLL